MKETHVDEGRLRRLFKEAFVETLEERRDLFYNLFVEVIEDIALVRAIQEGENTEPVSRQKIFKLLEALDMKIEFRKSFTRDLKRIQEKRLLKQVEEVIQEIEVAESTLEIKNLKKLGYSVNFY